MEKVIKNKLKQHMKIFDKLKKGVNKVPDDVLLSFFESDEYIIETRFSYFEKVKFICEKSENWFKEHREKIEFDQITKKYKFKEKQDDRDK